MTAVLGEPASVNCPRCEAENSSRNQFCEACGAPLQTICSSCGHTSSLSSRFCGQCGALASADIRAAKAPERSVPAEAAAGERKRITILFADIVDSTKLIEGDDPELALQRLAPVIDLMKEAVHRYDGVVNEVLGDGVMALFGAPKPLENHAISACMAGLALQEAVAKLQDSQIRVRVGMHTGEVVVQAVHASLTDKLGALGSAVHVASRMEQMAEPGLVLATADTYDEVKRFIEARPLGDHLVKGVSEPVSVYRIIGARVAPASEIFRARDRLEPMLGRESQLAQLHAALADAAQGEACMVGVVGEAGIGKSRICFEFVEECRRAGIAVLEARAPPFGFATPFELILDLLRDYFRIRTSTDAQAARNMLTERLEALNINLSIAPLLFEFLGIAQTAPSARADPGVRKARLIEFACDLVRRGAGAGPAVILIEDLHWSDSGSADFIAALADTVYGSKTVLLVNFRPGLSAPWMQRSHYRQINLGPLDPALMDGLIAHALGTALPGEEIRRSLLDRSQGNPFFLEELIRTVATASSQSLAVPANVQALLAARIDQLDAMAKQVLQTAAVIGREVPTILLSEVATLDQKETADAMRRLRQAEMMFEVPRPDGATVVFRHPLIQEVAYRSLLSARKQAIHAAVAKSLQALSSSSSDQNAALRAYHLEQSGQMLAATKALMRSAIWVGANDSRLALATWKKVAHILRDLPETPETRLTRMTACGQVVNFGWREGIDADEARAYFEEASQIATATNSMRANALIHAAYGRVLASAGSADEYVEKIREAQALDSMSSDASLQVTLNAVLCHALRLSGRMKEAFAIAEDVLRNVLNLGKLDRETLGFDVEAWVLAMTGQTLVAMGRGEEARPFLDRVIQMDAAHVDVTNHFIPSIAYVEWAWSIGDRLLATTHATRAMGIAEKSGNPYLLTYAGWCRGLALIVGGAHEEAISVLSDTLAFARSKKAGLEHEARILADLANARLVAGDVDRSLELAEESIRVSTRRCQRLSECFARSVKYEALLATSRRAEADAEMQIVTLLVEVTGGRLFGARVGLE